MPEVINSWVLEGPPRAPKIRISAYGSEKKGVGSTDYGGSCADSNRSALRNRRFNIFGTGVGVRSSRLATNARAISDAGRQARLAGLMDTHNPRRRWNGKPKSDVLASFAALSAAMVSDPSEEKEANNSRAGGEDGTQRDDDPYTKPIAAPAKTQRRST